MSKVILILSDGLRNDTAADQMGYLEHLVEASLATRRVVIAELPTMSRPLYETLHTGLPVSSHGITGNRVVRRSTVPNVFDLAVKHSMTTAASAHHWFSELYNRCPYDPATDREVDDSSLLIQHGRFYSDDATPDSEVIASGAMLVQKFAPDYTLIHLSGMDLVGETHGGGSSEYRRHASKQDALFAAHIPTWLRDGYVTLVTADHGVSDDAHHGGALVDVRHVPLYVIKPGVGGEGDTKQVVSQLGIAPSICSLLGVPVPESMVGARIA